MIDSAVLGGPYVFATATLASAKPASPFVFRWGLYLPCIWKG